MRYASEPRPFFYDVGQTVRDVPTQPRFWRSSQFHGVRRVRGGVGNRRTGRRSARIGRASLASRPQHIESSGAAARIWSFFAVRRIAVVTLESCEVTALRFGRRVLRYSAIEQQDHELFAKNQRE